jgi:hypothetical protein
MTCLGATSQQQFTARSLTITETAQDLQHLFNYVNQPSLKDRIVALYLLKIERVNCLHELSKIIGCEIDCLEHWLTLYQNRGLAALLALESVYDQNKPLARRRGVWGKD